MEALDGKLLYDLVFDAEIGNHLDFMFLKKGHP
jgi:hypothetical protein